MNVTDKIRKLLALSTSPNVHEAQLAFEAATKLLALHQLTLADVERQQLQSVTLDLPKDGWHFGLLSVCARVSGVVLVLSKHEALLFSTDMAALHSATHLYQTLRTAIEAMAEREWLAHVDELTDLKLGPYPSLLEPGAKEEWQASWFTGVVAGFLDRVTPMQEQAARTTDSTLVRVLGPSETLRERVQRELKLAGPTVGRSWMEDVQLSLGSFKQGVAHGKSLR